MQIRKKQQAKIIRSSPDADQASGHGGSCMHGRTRLLIFFCSVVAYAVAFVVLFCAVGSNMSISAVIPVLTAGCLFGFVPGIVTGILSLPANLVLRLAMGVGLLGDGFTPATSIAGTCAVILIGASSGKMRDLGIRFKTELFERKKAETAVKNQRDQLDRQTMLLLETNSTLEKESSERKCTLEEVRKSKEQLENFIGFSLDPIAIGDSSGNIIKPNRAFLTMVGYSEQEIIGTPIYSFSVQDQGTYLSTTGEQVSLGPDFFDDAADKIGRLFTEEKISNWETYYINKAGKVIPVTQNISFLHNDRGERIGSFGIIRDITEQHRSKLALIASKDAAEDANRSKSTFLANMSHEIRTPMNGVIGFTDMLLDTRLTAEQADYAQTIKRSGEALLSLINDILDFSKIEAGRIEVEEIDFDIEVLAYDVCELVRPKAADRGLEVLCRVGDNLPAQLCGDPHRFRQVLVNLMGNAVKFTRAGEIELSLDVEKEQQDCVLIHTKIRDTGPGIPGDKLETIFEVFQQADSSTTREHGGTGLGLSICRKIAQLMDGTVWAESRPGAGSVFHFTALVKKASGKAAKRIAPQSLAGKKVLVIDDNHTNLEILTHIIQSAGMQPVAFSDGHTALQALASAAESSAPFDICVLDIMMPGMSGYDIARHIRAVHGRQIPLLAFTSSTERGADKCEKAGFNGYLPKPIKRIRLIKMLERLLGESAQHGQKNSVASQLITQHSMREDAKHAVSILLAEDNPVNQKLALKLLNKAGYRVHLAANGREAVDMLSAAPQAYDIILMDIQMPELNGLDAARALRKRDFTSIPIIAMTANAMKGDRERCLAAGMNDYISKPIKREVVLDMLNRWVFDKRRSMQERGATS